MGDIRSLTNLFGSFDPREFLLMLLNSEFYDILFPFLLIFAVMYTVLTSDKIKIFKTKSDGLNKAGAFIVTLAISLFSVYYETSPGMTIGTLLMMMFPSISTLTILTLTLYILGALFGKNFFKGFYDKEKSAYLHFIIGAIGLGYVVYYLGIAFGMWDFKPTDTLNQWNVILGVGMLILGIVFVIIGMLGFGLILLFVLGTFIVNSGDGFILEYFFDPVIFTVIIIIFLMSWLGVGRTPKEQLRKDLQDEKETYEGYVKRNGGKEPEMYDSKIYDISNTHFEKNKKKWEEEYPGESWEK